MAGKVKFDQEAAFKSIIGGTERAPDPGLKQETNTIDRITMQASGRVNRGRPKADRETKKRVSLALYPSSYGDLQKIAYVKRKSVSDIISELIAQYVADNAAVLEEYDKIKSE
jgi:hypothetical protein